MRINFTNEALKDADNIDYIDSPNDLKFAQGLIYSHGLQTGNPLSIYGTPNINKFDGSNVTVATLDSAPHEDYYKRFGQYTQIDVAGDGMGFDNDNTHGSLVAGVIDDLLPNVNHVFIDIDNDGKRASLTKAGVEWLADHGQQYKIDAAVMSVSSGDLTDKIGPSILTSYTRDMDEMSLYVSAGNNGQERVNTYAADPYAVTVSSGGYIGNTPVVDNNHNRHPDVTDVIAPGSYKLANDKDVEQWHFGSSFAAPFATAIDVAITSVVKNLTGKDVSWNFVEHVIDKVGFEVANFAGNAKMVVKETIQEAQEYTLGLLLNDTIYGTEKNEHIRGGAGDDYIHGGDGSDRLDGNVGDDTINGGNGGDIYYGGEGDDVLLGWKTHGTIGYGGNGDDIADGGAKSDQWIMGAGNDTVYGYGGNDFINLGEGDDTGLGHGGNDLVHGKGGNDYVTGGLGDDTLIGGDGKDTVHGGHGDDKLTGGSGRDEFIFNSKFGNDTITDLSAEDVIIVDGQVAYQGGVVSEAFADHASLNDAGDLKIDLGEDQSVILPDYADHFNFG